MNHFIQIRKHRAREVLCKFLITGKRLLLISKSASNIGDIASPSNRFERRERQGRDVRRRR